MSFFRSFHNSNKEKIRKYNKSDSKTFSSVQQWSYYQDLAMQSGHCTISSELVSLRHSHFHRSLYNLIYTPNDELDYFIHYMDSCSLLSYIKFILDINTFEKILRENSNDDHQTIALTLFHRYLSIDAKYSVPINDAIRRTTLLLICPSNNNNKPDSNCFHMAREHIWELIEQNAYPIYLESSFHLNYQLKMLTSNELQLHDFLYHNNSLSYLMKFAEQEKITNLIRFWIDVEDFYQNIINRQLNNQVLTQNALSIYEQYISLQAPLRLGFDDVIRAKIECSICQPDLNAGPSIDTFDQASWIVYIILQRQYFPQFLQSTIFYRYITDLMLKLRHDDSISHSQQMKTFDSDRASINSDTIIQSKPLNRQRNISTSSSCLSINQETDIRPKGRFSMGYVDSLGRFIRDPDVDSIDNSSSLNRKTPSKPFQFITQLVRNEQDEIVTDEAAAQFAKTFINEITNHTANLDID
ncbi:unnamed protein product [Adineta steineri]|uniref:RGS domain-containing protein n=1 Tax=Adineta steineri TaxID=433720 RepID=A0A813REG5_9BILA|nr:unnamed protein product [Adineta steineri]CAF0830004.1 unnamed protein product [Adineta steineri]